MKKHIILTFVLIIFILNIETIIFSVKDASMLFFNKIFISIFPFIILSDILIYYNYHYFLKNNFIGKFISKLFNIDYNSTSIFILSILTGTPTNAILINRMINDKKINKDIAEKLLTFTYFPSIPFVIGSIGISTYNNIKIGLVLYTICLINNVMIGLYLKNKNKGINIENDNPIIKSNFFIMIKNSILNAINNCYIILGNLIIFTIIINLFNKYININSIISAIISGIFELTNGIINISLLDININFKILLSSFLLNFTGLSILFQSFSILNEYKFNIKKILIIKLIFSLTSTVILYFLLLIWNPFRI